MTKERSDRNATWLLLAFALFALLFHLIFGNRYGFHRDELQFLADALHLDWGYVPYPPLTSWLGRLSVSVFGISPLALRLPAMLLSSAMLVLGGLTARALGGRRFAQVLTVLMMLGIQLIIGQWLMYVITDAMAWTLAIFGIAKMLETDDERWWLLVGAAIGLGVLSKYTIAFFVTGLLAGLLALPSQWRHLRSRWFYAGALLALVIAAPNLLWQWRHDFVTLKMLHFIHARDVRIGRAEGYFTDQLKYMATGLPFAIAGVVWLVRSARYRLLLFLYAVPFVLLALAKGRGYYLLPAYLPLYAAGAVWFEAWTLSMRSALRGTLRTLAVVLKILGATAAVLMSCAVAPLGSSLLHWQLVHSSDVRDQFGWPEMVAAITRVRDTLPQQERAGAAVVVGNYGEAGAVALYGPVHGLPYPISSANTFYFRGYVRPNSGNPQTLIAIGIGKKDRERLFVSCAVGGEFVKPFSVGNDDEEGQPIYICRGMKTPWAELWPTEQHFG